MSKRSRPEEIQILKQALCNEIRAELEAAGEIISDVKNLSDAALISRLSSFQLRITGITELVTSYRDYDNEAKEIE